MAISDQEHYLLPCGRDADTLWTHVTSGGHDEHEQACPHCQAAAAGFRALHRAAGELARLDDTPPPELTERIMRAVRAETHGSRRIVVEATQLGVTRISAQAAAVVLRFAANQTPHADARSCRVNPDPETGPGRYRVQLSLTLRYGASAAHILPRIRQLVYAAARDLVGFEATRIDIDVTDIDASTNQVP